MTEGLVIDTPTGIEAYRLIATLKGLEIEIKWGPQGGPTRGMVLASARRILAQYNVPGTAWGKAANACVPHTRKQALQGMKFLLEDQLQLIPKES